MLPNPFSVRRESSSQNNSDPLIHANSQFQIIQHLIENYTLQSPVRQGSPKVKHRPLSPTSPRRASLSLSRQNSGGNLTDLPCRVGSTIHPPLEDFDSIDNFVRKEPSNLVQVLPAFESYLQDFIISNPKKCLDVWDALIPLLKQIETWKEDECRSLSNKNVIKRPKSPSCKEKPKKWINVHNEEWEDNFAWLNDRESQEVLDYIEAENKYSEEIMKETKPLQKLLYKEFVSRLDENEESAKVTLPDNYTYYSRKVPGEEYRVHCRMNESGKEEVYLDENEMANSTEFENASFFRIGFLKHSPDCKLVAYGVDSSGNERNTVYFMKLETKELLEDRIEGVYEDFEFSADNSYVYYTLLDDGERAYRAKRHKIGTPVQEDELLYHEKDEMFYLSLTKTGSGKHILVNTKAQITSETRYISTENSQDTLHLLIPRQEGIQYSCDSDGEYFYVLSNEDSKNNWLYRIRIPESSTTTNEYLEDLLSSRETVIDPRDFVLIEDFHLRRKHLIVVERSNCLQNVRIVDLSTPGFSAYHYINFSDAVYSLWPGSVNEEVADLTKASQYDTNLFRFTYTSFTQPKQVVDYDMDTRKTTVVHEERVDGILPYDADRYCSKRLYATGVDGTTVPVSIVYRRDLLGLNAAVPFTNPVLLHAYGAYGAFVNPIFSTNRLSLLDRGFVYAVAHVRGGADMGNAWYEEGKLGKKPNTFLDFISVAEYLCKEGYTEPGKLAIYGRSAGGLLIGAVINMRPDLFRAALTEVPFVDVINTMFDPTIPWTAFEYEEWGNPNDYEIYQVMKTYCPYTNIQGNVLAKEGYPHMLVVGGMNDPRVAFFEPLKLIAKMRSEKQKFKENMPSDDDSNNNDLKVNNKNVSMTRLMDNHGSFAKGYDGNINSDWNSNIPLHGLKNSLFSTSEGQLMLLRVDDVGHGGPSGQYSYLEDLAFEYAFLIAALEAPIQPLLPVLSNVFGNIPDHLYHSTASTESLPTESLQANTSEYTTSTSFYNTFGAAFLGGLFSPAQKRNGLENITIEDDFTQADQEWKVEQKGKRKGQGIESIEKEEYRNKSKGDRGQNRVFQAMQKTLRLSKLFNARSFFTSRSTLQEAIAQTEEVLTAEEKLSRAKERDEDPALKRIRSTTPFPRNPLFKPTKPLSNSTRDAIYDLWATQKIEPFAVAEKFGISKIRVDAIIRMKWLEKQIFKNKDKAPFPVQSIFAEEMDKLLSAVDLSRIAKDLNSQSRREQREPVRFITADRMKPFFQLINEDDPNRISKASADLEADQTREDERKKQISGDKKPADGSERFEFVIVDTAVSRRKRMRAQGIVATD